MEEWGEASKDYSLQGNNFFSKCHAEFMEDYLSPSMFGLKGIWSMECAGICTLRARILK